MNEPRPASACRYVEVCGLPYVVFVDQQPYCVLHCPSRNTKDADEFKKALSDHLQKGSCDFRHIIFPENRIDADLDNRTFTAPADFSGMIFPEVLNLYHSRFEGGLTLGGQ